MTMQHIALISLFFSVPSWFCVFALVFMAAKEMFEDYFDQVAGVPAYVVVSHRRRSSIAPVYRQMRGEFRWKLGVLHFSVKHSINLQVRWYA